MKLPALDGAVVSLDALDLYNETIELIVNGKNGHALVGLKANRPKLLNEVTGLFKIATGADITRVTCTEDNHGRIEQRTVEIIPFSTGTKYKYLATAMRVTREFFYKKSGKTTRDIAYYIGTFTIDDFSPAKVQKLIRGHWGIENRLHHPKDRTMKEDRCRARCYCGANMALIRSVVTMMKQHAKQKIKGIIGALKAAPEITVKMITNNYGLSF